MFNGFRQRFVRRSELFARRAYSLGKAAVSAAYDHAKIWTIGMTVVLKMSSIFFLIPFRLANQQGLYTLEVAPEYHVFLTVLCNIAGGLRLAFFILTSLFQGKSKWYFSGQFTADAIFAAVWFILAFSAFVAHLMMLYRKEEFAFLYNATSKLSKTFSSTWFFAVQKLTSD